VRLLADAAWWLVVTHLEYAEWEEEEGRPQAVDSWPEAQVLVHAQRCGAQQQQRQQDW
jgi:hypothetical protein